MASANGKCQFVVDTGRKTDTLICFYTLPCMFIKGFSKLRCVIASSVMIILFINLQIQSEIFIIICFHFSTVQSLSRVQLFATPWTTARQASLAITNSRSSPKLISIESVMPSNHLIFCHPLLLLPSIFPSIRVFSNESALRIRWPKYWSFSFNISPSNEQLGLMSFRMDWL